MGLNTKNIQSPLKLGPTPVAVRDSRKCFGRVIFHQVINHTALPNVPVDVLILFSYSLWCCWRDISPLRGF